MKIRSKLKKLAERFPRLLSAYRFLRWRKHVWNDWKDNVLGETLRSGRTPFGFSIVVRNHPANRAMLEGTFEPDETNFLLKHFPKTDVFVDVGANIGFYTLLALSKGKDVLAVEPQRKNLDCLFASLEANGFEKGFEIFPVGLGKSPGLSVLYGASGPSASLVKNWGQYNPAYKQIIPLSTLDILLDGRFPGKRLLIKIDVEGFEYTLLQGSLLTIGRSPRPTWLIEICLEEYYPAEPNPHYMDIFELFWNHGYEARTADPQSRLVSRADVSRWVAENHSDSGTINYVFSAPEVI